MHEEHIKKYNFNNKELSYYIGSLYVIAFPYEIVIGGLMGGPLSTYLIYLLYGVVVFRSIERTRSLWLHRYELVMLLLVTIGAITTLSNTDGKLLNGIRFFYVYASGFILFAMLLRLKPIANNDPYLLNKTINLIFFIVATNLLLGLLFYYTPALSHSYSGLLNLPVELGKRMSDGGIHRLSSPITGPEATGEIIATLSAILLVKALHTRDKIAYFILMLFFVCLLLTATRSGIVLSALSCGVMFYYLNRYHTDLRTAQLTILIVFISVLIVISHQEILDALLQRLSKFSGNIDSTTNFAQALNRTNVWESAFIGLRESNMLGNGFTRFSEGDYTNFHSLYLTVLFQLGIAGFAIFFTFLFAIILGLTNILKKSRAAHTNPIVFATLLSLCVFMINEFKFEFTRFAPYLQTCWLFFFICFECKRVYGGKPLAVDDKTTQ